MKTTKPVSSPVGAVLVALATTGRSTVPPGGIVTDEVPGAIEEPGVAVCGSIETFHAPPPVPASESESSSGLRASWPSTLRKPNESDERGEELRVVRGRDVDQAAALEQRRGLPRAGGVAQAGCAEVISADLTCWGDQARMLLQQQCRGARDVRRRHARAVENRERCARELGQRRGEDLAAGAATSGLACGRSWSGRRRSSW